LGYAAKKLLAQRVLGSVAIQFYVGECMLSVDWALSAAFFFI